MNSTSTQNDMARECERLKQQVERDAGTHALSQTELAFLESYCGYKKDELPEVPGAMLSKPAGVDNSGGGDTGTIFDDPDAGTPDDPADANPAAPDPAIVRK
jgi:hypothetical protein